jgi:hypothetical protein
MRHLWFALLITGLGLDCAAQDVQLREEAETLL